MIYNLSMIEMVMKYFENILTLCAEEGFIIEKQSPLQSWLVWIIKLRKGLIFELLIREGGGVRKQSAVLHKLTRQLIFYDVISIECAFHHFQSYFVVRFQTNWDYWWTCQMPL